MSIISGSRAVLLAVLFPMSAVTLSWGGGDALRLVPKPGTVLTYRMTSRVEAAPAGGGGPGSIYSIVVGSSAGSLASATRKPIAALLQRSLWANCSGDSCPPAANISETGDYVVMPFPEELALKAQAKSELTLSSFIPVAYVTADPEVDPSRSEATRVVIFQDSYHVVGAFLDCKPSDIERFLPLGRTNNLDMACQQRTKDSYGNRPPSEKTYPVRLQLSYGGKVRTTTPAGPFETHIIEMSLTAPDYERRSTFYFSDEIGATVKQTGKITSSATHSTMATETMLLKYAE
jgi:hypothetical protein